MVRFKNRYIVIEINPVHLRKNTLLLRDYSLYNAIIKKVQQVHGDFGIGAVKSGLTAKYCNKWTRIAMIRVRHGSHRLVTSCLPLISDLEKHAVTVNILFIGATLQQCYSHILSHQKKTLEKLWAGLETDELRSAMKCAFLDFSCLENDKSVQNNETEEKKSIELY